MQQQNSICRHSAKRFVSGRAARIFALVDLQTKETILSNTNKKVVIDKRKELIAAGIPKDRLFLGEYDDMRLIV